MSELFRNSNAVDFRPTLRAGRARLDFFRPNMGSRYAQHRNIDYGPQDRSNVSALSPWVRTRTLLEEDLARAALSKFAYSTTEKFHQEICWRTYFKGWLEHRPEVWPAYLKGRDAAYEAITSNAGLRHAYETAISGTTGIDGFDSWVGELVETGYLHNHARMWFASIWMFTLKLPWELGADFFLRHLLDGDPASNTLSWRWVGGLHTPGKTYLARRSNIEKNTDNRFSPSGLSPVAHSVAGVENPSPRALNFSETLPTGPVGILLTEDDLHVESLCPPRCEIVAIAGCIFPDDRSFRPVGEPVRQFLGGSLEDAMRRGLERYRVPTRRLTAEGFETDILNWVREQGLSAIVTGYPPTGWCRTRLDRAKEKLAEENVSLHYFVRDWDRAFWPHADKGFFKLKAAIPDVYAELGLPV